MEESWVEEIAKEELKKLENQHPNRFGYLKTELKLFISEPNLEPFFVLPEPIPLASTQYISTQLSSNRKRNLDYGGGKVPNKEEKKRRKERSSSSKNGRMKDNVELAIERAEACLERIREFKKSLTPPWFNPHSATEQLLCDK